MKKKSDPKIWVNVTTIYNWNRPAVGVIRVESEFVRFLLEASVNDHYFIFDKTHNAYIEVSKESVRQSLRKQKNTTIQSSNIDTKETNNITQVVKQFIKRIHLLLPSPLNQIFWSFFIYFRKLYRYFFLIPRFYIRLFIKLKILPFWKSLTNKQASIQGKPANFHSDDWVLSMGLNWDYLYGDRLGEFDIKRKSGAKIAFVCYDLIPIKFPHLCVFEVANKFSKYFADVAWIADHIFCISKNSMLDLQEFLQKTGAPIPTMSVIRLGDNLPKEKVVVSKLSTKAQMVIENKPYILFVSTIERRKNHEVLYRAYRRLLEQRVKNLPQLVFVGMPGWGVNDFLQDLRTDPLVRDKITILSNVSDDELDQLIKNCLFTVYPSLYEGWGLPVAESLAYGKFCLVANNSSLPEVGGDLVEYLDPWDVNAWAQRIRYYSFSQSALQKRNLKIQEKYLSFSWSQMTIQILSRLKVIKK